MDLEIDRDDRQPTASLTRDLDRDRVQPIEQPALSREREIVRDRNRVWRVSPAERETLFAIGRFRTVAERDLLKHLYRGRMDHFRDDLASLAAQGLLQRRSAPLRKGHGALEVVVLTREGKRLLEAS